MLLRTKNFCRLFTKFSSAEPTRPFFFQFVTLSIVVKIGYVGGNGMLRWCLAGL